MIFARGFTISALVFLLTEPQVIAGGSGCNETIYLNNTPSGSIYSPGYPYNYDNNENCLWLLVAPIGSKVLLYFTTFEVEDHSWCDYDSVELFDGHTSSSASLSKSCGGSLPSPVYSSSRYMFMQFKSDSYVTGKGFVAHYRELHDSSGCPQIVPGASAGVIYSPNFPWNYPNSISCNWAITPKYSRIKLSFMKFDLEDYSCGADYVEVTSGYGYQIGKYCGSQIPSPVIQSGSMHVKFHSDHSVSYSGFMAFYEILDSFPTPYPTYWSNPMSWTSPTYWPNPTSWPWSRHTYYTRYPATYSPPKASRYICNRHYQTNIFVASSSSSSIASGSDIDGYYPTSRPYSSCTFQINTASGYILELSFTKMSISSCSDCSCGYVKVRDGTKSSSRFLGTFCNSNYRDVVTTGNHMFVEFYARYWNDNFKATVRSKKASGVNVPAIAVPIVAAVVLFTIILIVINCTKIRRLSAVHEVPLQSSAPGAEQPPTTQALYCNAGFGMNQQPSAPNTEFAVHPYPQPLATASHPPLPSSTDYSQGNTNMALAAEMA